MTVALAKWIEVLDREYLRSFIAGGGAAVKIAVSPPGPAVASAIQAAASASGYVGATIDSRAVRVDRIEQLFGAASREVDWIGLADAIRERAIVESNYSLPAEPPWTVETIAETNGIAVSLVRKTLQQWFSDNVFRDYKMSQDFRAAMMMLCLDTMSWQSGGGSLSESVLEWVRCELRLISAVRQAQIYEKVGRHNARDMFISLAHWVRAAGHAGLAVVVDIRAAAVRSKALAGDANFYTRAAVMDLYEVLRQFIDSTDEMEGLLIVVIADENFVLDEQRGVDIYSALRLRTSEEVRDRHRDNPLASLVRLEA